MVQTLDGEREIESEIILYTSKKKWIQKYVYILWLWSTVMYGNLPIQVVKALKALMKTVIMLNIFP